jgi:gas vesicle protein
MRQLKALILASLALVFVAGVGTGAWIGSLAAATPAPTLDRRVRDFTKVYDLSPTQVRQLREILYDHDQKKKRLQQPTPEQKALEAETRGHIRQMLTEEQLVQYDRRAAPR